MSPPQNRYDSMPHVPSHLRNIPMGRASRRSAGDEEEVRSDRPLTMGGLPTTLFTFLV